MFDAIDVLSNGLSVARTRMNVLSSNIANAETTRTEEGGPYQRRDIVQMAVTQNSSFSNLLDRMSLSKPYVQQVVTDSSDPKMVYKPGHPDADQNGFVAFPNINVVSSMTEMMTGLRNYQAMVTALQTTRDIEREASRISIRF